MHGHGDHHHCASLPALAKGSHAPTTKSRNRQTGCSHKEKKFATGRLKKSGKSNVKSTKEEMFPKSIKRKGSKNKISVGKKNFQAGEIKRSGNKNTKSKSDGNFRAGDLTRGPKDKQSTKEVSGMKIKRSNTMHKKGKGTKSKSISRSGKMCQTSETLGYKSRPRGKSGVADKTKQSKESGKSSGIMRKDKGQLSVKEHSRMRKGSGAEFLNQFSVSDPKKKIKPAGLTIRKDRDQNRHSPIHGPRSTAPAGKKRSKKKSSLLTKYNSSHSSIFKADHSPRSNPKVLAHNMTTFQLGDDSKR